MRVHQIVGALVVLASYAKGSVVYEHTIPANMQGSWWTSSTLDNDAGWATYDSFSVPLPRTVNRVYWTGFFIYSDPDRANDIPEPISGGDWTIRFVSVPQARLDPRLIVQEDRGARVHRDLGTIPFNVGGTTFRARVVELVSELSTPLPLTGSRTYWFSPSVRVPSGISFAWGPGSGGDGSTVQFRLRDATRFDRNGDRAFRLEGGQVNVQPPALSTCALPLETQISVAPLGRNGCWSASTEDSWISFAGATSGVGAGSLTVLLQENVEDESRRGEIYVSGNVIEVFQDRYSNLIRPNSKCSSSFSADGFPFGEPGAYWYGANFVGALNDCANPPEEFGYRYGGELSESGRCLHYFPSGVDGWVPPLATLVHLPTNNAIAWGVCTTQISLPPPTIAIEDPNPAALDALSNCIESIDVEGEVLSGSVEALFDGTLYGGGNVGDVGGTSAFVPADGTIVTVDFGSPLLLDAVRSITADSSGASSTSVSVEIARPGRDFALIAEVDTSSDPLEERAVAIRERLSHVDRIRFTFHGVAAYREIDVLGQDVDSDGVPDGCDNCPELSNADQTDLDRDGIGDACDAFVDVPRFSRCNVDGAGVPELSDAIQILLWLFATGDLACRSAANCDGSAAVDVSDAIFLLNFLLAGGAVPGAPYPDCGPAEAFDHSLGCEDDSACAI
ncbi:MAG: thrombospondin type 3 repeat-containing protein [Planctomycetota bacterium]